MNFFFSFLLTFSVLVTSSQAKLRRSRGRGNQRGLRSTPLRRHLGSDSDGILEGDVFDLIEEPLPDQCTICNKDDDIQIKINELEIQYLSAGKTSIFQGEKAEKCGKAIYPTKVNLEFQLEEELVIIADISDGDIFVVSGKFKSNTEVKIISLSDDTETECEFHTSCSVPVIAGDVIGPFKLIGSPQASCRVSPASTKDAIAASGAPSGSTSPSGVPSTSNSPSGSSSPSEAPSTSTAPSTSVGPTVDISPRIVNRCDCDCSGKSGKSGKDGGKSGKDGGKSGKDGGKNGKNGGESGKDGRRKLGESSSSEEESDDDEDSSEDDTCDCDSGKSGKDGGKSGKGGGKDSGKSGKDGGKRRYLHSDEDEDEDVDCIE